MNKPKNKQTKTKNKQRKTKAKIYLNFEETLEQLKQEIIEGLSHYKLFLYITIDIHKKKTKMLDHITCVTIMCCFK